MTCGQVVLDANSAEEDTSQALSLLALADQFVMCELKHQLTPLLQAQLSVEVSVVHMPTLSTYQLFAECAHDIASC